MQLITTAQGNAMMIDTDAYKMGEVMPHLQDHPAYNAGQKSASEYVSYGECLSDREQWLKTVSIILEDMLWQYSYLSPHLRGYYNELSYYRYTKENDMIYLPA